MPRINKNKDNISSDSNNDSDSDSEISDDYTSDDSQEDSDICLTNESSLNKITAVGESRTTISSSDQKNSDEFGEARSNVCEENNVVKAILDAEQLHTNHPPSIILEDMVTDICFHPARDIIGVASVTGDIFMYKYNNAETNLISTIEIHLQACRDIEFSKDGQLLFSVGKERSIAITDVQSEKLTKLYEDAHEEPVYTMTLINEHVFATGDDDGTVKLWDLRQKESKPVFSIKQMEDYVAAMITNRDSKYLVCASGDGCLTTINMPEKKLHVQSEEYEEELTCLGLFKSDTKLLSASSKGKMYVYNWGQFGLHSDEFPSITKKSINCMVPITENIVITGGEDGVVRATSLFPHLQLGVVGQHNFSIESLDINNDGTLIASCSHNNDIKFWNVEYFETLNITESVKGGKRKRLLHNLPSSQMNNPSDFFAEL